MCFRSHGTREATLSMPYQHRVLKRDALFPSILNAILSLTHINSYPHTLTRVRRYQTSPEHIYQTSVSVLIKFKHVIVHPGYENTPKILCQKFNETCFQ